MHVRWGGLLIVALGVACASDGDVDCSRDASAPANGANGTQGTNGSGGNGSGDAGAPDATSPFDAGETGGGDGGTTLDAGEACGQAGGRAVTIAEDIQVCLPPVVCNPETCPPGLGTCVDGECRFLGDYRGLATYPEAWATHYCDLLGGGCHGVSQVEFAEDNADAVATAHSLPLCQSALPHERCVGISASPPMMVGNSEEAKDPVTGERVDTWGLGMTEASGLCYELDGPGGPVLVLMTDRCGGYCTCNGSGFQECGPCVNAPDMSPHCACVGTVPGLWGDCCGVGCGAVKQDCDWCASNNHPHFDLDVHAFNHLCGEQALMGSCRLTRARPVPCMAPNPAWPPGGTNCKENSFWCEGPQPHHAQVPGTTCCCNYDLTPQPDGTCR